MPRNFTRKEGKIVVWGEKGIENIACTQIPCEARGAYTGRLYVWCARRPTLPVDVRDKPGLAKIENATELFPALAELKARKSARKKEAEQPQTAQSDEAAPAA